MGATLYAVGGFKLTPSRLSSVEKFPKLKLNVPELKGSEALSVYILKSPNVKIDGELEFANLMSSPGL